MSIVIKIENLSKSYRLGEVGTGTISHDLNRFFARIRGKEDPFAKVGSVNDRTKAATKGEIVNALSNINLEIHEGDILGIIGKNGAGKSTLLKILSRITAPTTGSYKIKGRMASLLEVGTGFHPEMTGRENIFMNGTIMGMRKREIDAKLDEIVEFAGVAKYLDTPVKRYSSGMTVRLGFAVAAHLNSEILVVDEVLAVGDAEFQSKAIGKMQDVSRGQGRTVLFVSHNLGAVNQLCTNCILLSKGEIISSGITDNIIKQYMGIHGNSESSVILSNINCTRSGNKKAQFQELWLKKENTSENCRIFSIGQSMVIGFKIKFNKPNEKKIKTAIELKTSEGLRLANMIDVDSHYQVEFSGENIATYNVILEDMRLYPGTYFLSFYAGDITSIEKYDYVEDCMSFEIIDGGNLTTRTLPQSAGVFFFTPKWSKIN